MDTQRRTDDPEQLERHSLPGTNMAGKGPADECEASMKDMPLDLPTFGFVVMTRAILGVGLGLLIAGRLSDQQRRAVGRALVAVGVATTIPAAFAVFGRRERKAFAPPPATA